MRISERQLGFPNAAQPVDDGGDARSTEREIATQGDEILHAASERGIVSGQVGGAA